MTLNANRQENGKMMTIEEIRKHLADLRPSRVADATGLHYNTVRDIRDNPNANPTYRALKALSEYLEDRKEPSQ